VESRTKYYDISYSDEDFENDSKDLFEYRQFKIRSNTIKVHIPVL